MQYLENYIKMDVHLIHCITLNIRNMLPRTWAHSLTTLELVTEEIKTSNRFNKKKYPSIILRTETSTSRKLI